MRLESSPHEEPRRDARLFILGVIIGLSFFGAWVCGMKRIALWSAFFLATVVLGFLLHPAAVWTVSAANDGTSSGYNPAGLYWSRPYTRFVPMEYEPAVSLALDLGVSCLAVAGLFLVIARKRRVSAPVPVADEPIEAPVKEQGRFARIKPRLWLIPAWFVAQFLYEIPGAWSEDHSSLLWVALRALSAQTSPVALFTSLAVIIAAIFYKTPTPAEK